MKLMLRAYHRVQNCDWIHIKIAGTMLENKPSQEIVMPSRSTVIAFGAALSSLVSSAVLAQDLPPFAANIAAGTIAVLSDGDFEGATYATGRLAPLEAGHEDRLTVLDLRDRKASWGTLKVSNSVTAAPEVLALTADGRTAFVTERLKPRTQGGDTVPDLLPGDTLFAVDLSDRSQTRFADMVKVTAYPEALALDPEGRRLALVSNTPEGAFVQIVPYNESGFGNVARFNLANVGVTGTAAGPRGGVTATNVQWHPSGRFLAVNINTQNRVVFFQVEDEEGQIDLRAWGESVVVGPDPFVGRFTPDGRFYLTSDWGRDLTAQSLDGRVPNRPSTISVIRLADPDGSSLATHERIASAETDVAAEGLAVSPDGRLVATVNMRSTAFLPSSPRFEREASITLLRLDPASGAIEKIANYPVEGILPEGGTFDTTGEHFMATVFQGHGGAAADKGSGLEMFKVEAGETPSLVRLGRIPFPHGAHHVAVAP